MGFVADATEFAAEVGPLGIESLGLPGGRGASALGTVRSKAEGGRSTQQLTCDRGGTWDVTTPDPATTIITFTDCRMTDLDDPDVELYFDGTITFFLQGTTEFSITYSGFYYVSTRISTGRLLEEGTLNLTVESMIVIAATCNDLIGRPITTLVDGTYSVRGDEDEDGTVDYDFTVQNRAFQFVTVVNALDPGCEPTDVTVTVTGGLDFTDNLTSLTYSMDFSTADPLVMNEVTAAGGMNITISGTFTLNTTCFSGTVTVETTAPIFIPDGADCPTAGVLVVTGDLTGTITFTPSGGVEVDNGSDGTVDETYASCEEAFENPCSVL